MIIQHPTLGTLILVLMTRGEGDIDFLFWNPQTNKYYMLREISDIMPEN